MYQLLEDVSVAGRCISCWKMYLSWKMYQLLEDLSATGRCISCWKMYLLLEDVSAAGRCISSLQICLLLEDVSVPYRYICCWCSCSYPPTGLFIIFSVPLLLQTSSLALSGPGLSLLHKHDMFVLQRLPCLNIVTSSLRKDRTHLTANSFPFWIPMSMSVLPMTQLYLWVRKRVS